MVELSAQEYIVTPKKNKSDGVNARLPLNGHRPQSELPDVFASINSHNHEDKRASGVLKSSKIRNNTNLNRTKVAGVFWVSNARLLCLIMALDLMTLSVQIPSLPAVFESHGMDLRWQGWVSSVYGVMSFLMSPMLGRVSDSVGRVNMLKVSAVGSMLGALGSLHATGKWSFIAARTLPGLMKCSLPISQAYMVDVSQGNAERSKHLGMLGASFGVAFVLGPPLGGRAADVDPRYPFVIAVLEGALLLVALHFMPEPSRKMEEAGGNDITGNTNKWKKLTRSVSSANISSAQIGGGGGDRGEGGKSLFPSAPNSSGSKRSLKRATSSSLIAAESGHAESMLLLSKGMVEFGGGAAVARVKSAVTEEPSSGSGQEGKGRLSIFLRPGGRQMGWGFHDRFFLVVAETLHHAAFAPFLTEVLGFPAGMIGELLSFIGAVSALTNAFLVGFLTERFGDKPLMTTSLLILAMGWIMWSAVTVSTISILAALTMVGVGGNVFQTVNKAAVAQHAPPELVGTIMGMSGAMETFGRTVAGPLCGYIFHAWGARGVPVTCACMAAYVAAALSVRGLSATAAPDGGACKAQDRAIEINRRRKERDH